MQLSTLELQQEIQLALETNPLLEQEEQSPEQDNLDILSSHTDSSEIDTKDALEKNDIPDELPLDADWDEIYTAGTPSGTSNDYSFDELPVYQGETTQTLQDYLIWQANLTPFTDTDRAIATSIIDSIDESGYLTNTISEIHEGIDDPDISLEEVVAVLKRIQHFDPLGVAAQDLKECLLIQLSLYPKETAGLQEARVIISDHIDLGN